MIILCYRDRCFCGFYKTCKDGKTCPRAKTESVINHAKKVKLHISVFVDKPECYRGNNEN